MKLRVVALALLAAMVALAFLAYLNPTNAGRWSILMALCQ